MKTVNSKTWNEIKTNDSWAIFKIMSEFVEGYERLSRIGPCVSIFGSARLKENHQWYLKAQNIAEKLGELGYGIISGGGPGIMEAANRGAKKVNSPSVGLNIELEHEQSPNGFIDTDKSVDFDYFFVRKVMFVKYSQGFVVMPGGFGTLDELFEALTLIQTKKLRKKIPIVLFDSHFWNKVVNWDFLVEKGVISKSDLELFHISDTVEDAYKYLTKKIRATHLSGPNF